MNEITVLIPVSPVPTHPSTEIIDKTIESIRERLPDSEIIIMIDGLPAWFAEHKTAYDEFTQRLLHKTNTEYGNCVPLLFSEHKHQSGMMRAALSQVRTPVVLFSEQDTPLHNEIPFEQLLPVVTSGYANLIRFHHEAQILDDHKHLMLDEVPINILGQPFLRTRQWSQRPHLASTQYYRDICEKYWDFEPRFIEHIMYGIVAEGGDNFDEHRVHIYAPSGTLVRHKHLDGRRMGADEYDTRPS